MGVGYGVESASLSPTDYDIVGIPAQSLHGVRLGDHGRSIRHDREAVPVISHLGDANGLHSLEFAEGLGDGFFAIRTFNSRQSSDIGNLTGMSRRNGKNTEGEQGEQSFHIGK